mgnify:CR=1 FL=1
MIDVKATIIALMQADATLMGLLVGGVYGVAELRPGMDGPTPFDAFGRVRPCALVRREVSTAAGPRGRFSRQFLVIFFYDSAGYEVITEAMNRTRALLHEQRVGNGAYEVRHVDTVDDQYDDALLAYMHRARYEVAVGG